MHVVVIGNGVTGITAAITIRKLSATHQITVISSESEHFFSRTALMYVYMGHMQYQHIKPYEDWFWPENNINLQQGQVTYIDVEQKQVLLDDQATLNFDKLLIATGSKPNILNLPGKELNGVQGFYSLNDLQTLEANSKDVNRAVLVGGGLIGIELAEMLYTRCIPVSFLVREEHYWGSVLPKEESQMIQSHILAHGIDLHLKAEVEEILGDASGKVSGVRTKSGEVIPCQLVGLGIGVFPNIDLIRNCGIKTNRGILVNEYLETNIPDIFAAGDCAELEKPDQQKVVEQLWYTGRMQGETVAYSICGTRKKYERGIWFNSAKFFDIEYQTYGKVSARLGPEEGTLLWQHPNRKKSIRINYLLHTQEVIGFNLLGIRYRHEVCERWIREKKTLDFVLKHLKEANFDPEFYRRYEKEVLRKFNEQFTATFALKDKG
ncbi:NAD(P)/FAD-dependent oxidoreductase [Adhaeribacter aquaticus]|uniref:NAD(P)/FAD-dependent oxidoreductase n=1 Tax=Adhaeribacter aquaticus TaxID=299567 RepID=UPI00040BD9C6|nr:FAD-dependent oxidoreductase [Adhaeribacter aquaticus]